VRCDVFDLIIFPLSQLVNLYGHRGFSAEGTARQGDLRVDHPTLSLLQDGSDWLEKQRETQPITQQVLPEGGEGCCE
jgi:hypothetical protein